MCYLVRCFRKSLFLGNCYKNQCIRNGILSKGDILQSESGKYQLKLQTNGKLEIICEGYVIWSPISGTDNDVAVLYFKNDGSLGLYREDNSSVWTPGIDTSTKHPQKLVLENDGRLVLYDNKSENIWDSNTADKCSRGKNFLVTKLQFGKIDVTFGE